MVAAAVILTPGKIPRGLNDSKQLNHERREARILAPVSETLPAVPIYRASRFVRRRAGYDIFFFGPRFLFRQWAFF